MFGKFKDKIVSNKDTILSHTIKVVVNKKFKEYGEMLKFNLNSNDKSIDLEVLLAGEKEPLVISIDKYEVIKDGKKSYIKIHHIKTSREWLNRLALQYVKDKRFEVPSEYISLLEMII